MSNTKGGNKRNTSTPVTNTPRVPDALSNLVDRFEELSALKALSIVMSVAVAMLSYIYWDFLVGDAVLLYADIGSDSVNYLYPLWSQMSQQWSANGLLQGFSLQTNMGSPLTINPFDVFQWIVIAGDPNGLADRIHLAEIAKSLITVATAFVTFKLMNVRNSTAFIGALSIAFCGWVALGSSGWYPLTTHIVLIILSLLAVELALIRKLHWYVTSALLFAFVSQIAGYFIIYLAAASVVYAIIRANQFESFKSAMSRAGLAIACLVVGLGLSFSALQDVYLLLTQSGRAEALNVVEGGRMSLKKDKPLTELVDRVELMNVVERTYSTNTLGVGSKFKGMTNYLEAPLLYMGLPMVLFFPLFGLGMSRRNKLLWGGVLAAVLLMLIFPWFRYAFWGFKLDYFREFTMLIGTVMLLVAMWGLDGLISNRSDRFRLWLPIAALIMIALPFAVSKPADGIDNAQRMFTVVMLSGIAASALAYAVTRRSAFLLGLLAFTVIDLSYNAHATINERSLLTRTDIRNGKLYGDGSVQALQWIRSNDGDLYRTVKYSHSGPAIHASINDAMVQGFNGLIGYASIHNKYYLRFMAEMECLDVADPNDAKWVYGIRQRPFLASALGAKYYVTKGAALGFVPPLFPEIHQTAGYYIHRSEVALPLLVAHDTYITPQAFRALPSIRKDLMMYKAVVLDAEQASALGLTPYNVLSDTTTTPPLLAEFVQAAADRRSMMPVAASTTAEGLTATVELKRSALVVIAVPYDPTLKVTVDGRDVPTIVSDFGLVGVKVNAGKHVIVLRAQ